MSAATDMIRHEIKSRFLRPSDESASVPRIRPPIRQPMKKDEAGRPVMNELAHYRDHSDMVVSEAVLTCSLLDSLLDPLCLCTLVTLVCLPPL